MRRVPLSLAAALVACTEPAPAPSAETDSSTDTASADADADADADTDTDTGVDTDTDPPPTDMPGDYTGTTRIVAVHTTGSDASSPATVWVLSPADTAATEVASLSVRADSRIDCAGDSIWVLESDPSGTQADRAIRIDADALSVVSTWDLGTLRGPRDIERVGEHWWIAAWGKPRLFRYDATGAETTAIDLSAWADEDGRAEPVAVLEDDAVVHVLTANYNTAASTYNTGHLLTVDIATDTVIADHPTAGQNPNGMAWRWGESVYIMHASTGGSGPQAPMDGGVEHVDLSKEGVSGAWLTDLTDVATLSAGFIVRERREYWLATQVVPDPIVLTRHGADGSAFQNWTGPVGLQAFVVHEGHYYGAEDAVDHDYLIQRDSVSGQAIADIDFPGRIKSVALCQVVETDLPDSGG